MLSLRTCSKFCFGAGNRDQRIVLIPGTCLHALLFYESMISILVFVYLMCFDNAILQVWMLALSLFLCEVTCRSQPCAFNKLHFRYYYRCNGQSIGAVWTLIVLCRVVPPLY